MRGATIGRARERAPIQCDAPGMLMVNGSNRLKTGVLQRGMIAEKADRRPTASLAIVTAAVICKGCVIVIL